MTPTVLTRAAAAALGSLLAVGLAPPVRTDAVPPPPVPRQRLYANRGTSLVILTLDRTGRVVFSGEVETDTRRSPQAVDVSPAGLLFLQHAYRGRPDVILTDPATAVNPFGLQGTDAVFSPDTTTVLYTRRITTVTGPVTETHDELRLYRPNDFTDHLVTSLPSGQVVTDLRYSLDGTGFWMHTVRSAGGAVGLQQYRFADHRIVRTIPLNGRRGCPELEILPSGQRAVLACAVRTAGGTRGQLWTVHLATGAVVRRTPLPAGRFVDTIHGRLSPTQLLVSAHSRRAGGSTVRWLGALDIAAMSVRSLPGSTNYRHAVTAY